MDFFVDIQNQSLFQHDIIVESVSKFDVKIELSYRRLSTFILDPSTRRSKAPILKMFKSQKKVYKNITVVYVGTKLFSVKFSNV